MFSKKKNSENPIHQYLDLIIQGNLIQKSLNLNDISVKVNSWIFFLNLGRKSLKKYIF